MSTPKRRLAALEAQAGPIHWRSPQEVFNEGGCQFLSGLTLYTWPDAGLEKVEKLEENVFKNLEFATAACAPFEIQGTPSRRLCANFLRAPTAAPRT